jgi:2-keto-4-pentenoate hydratase/2-oxohepta-3-ene-1,7-dioic acid hydratase in catechol pathway
MLYFRPESGRCKQRNTFDTRKAAERLTEFSKLKPSASFAAISSTRRRRPEDYKSHIADRNIAPAVEPGVFWKPVSSITGPETDIVLPPGSSDVHYEAELVLVIGKKAHHVSRADAAKYIFGVTAGNDVSERNWQKNDLQWFRAKGSDTFAALGPCIVQGLDYNDLLVQSRLNGEVRQSQRTSDLIFPVDLIVSYITGDIIEIEVEGVGVLRNRIARAPE